MVPYERIFKLLDKEIISDDLITRIRNKNFSRIAIMNEQGKVRGFIKTKTLVKLHLQIG